MTKRTRILTAVLFLTPALSLYLFFVISPVVQGGYLSFFDWNGIPSVPLEFVKFDNYIEMFTTPAFWRALKNSGIFILTAFFVQLPLSFILASFITRNGAGVRLFKSAYFMPVILPVTAIGIIWSNILFPNGGVLSTLLENIGLESLTRNWLGDPATATLTVALVGAWLYSGLNMIIIAAGLVAIPEEIYEAGEIDGAVGLKKTIFLTLPMMKETLKIYSILAITGSLRVFDIVFVMTHGGPNRASETLAAQMYYEAFRYHDFGYGSTIGVFILVTGLLVSILFNRVIFKEDPDVQKL